MKSADQNPVILRHAKDLFVSPVQNLFEPNLSPYSGIIQICLRIKRHPDLKEISLQILHRDPAVTDEHIRQSLYRYTSLKIARLNRKRKNLLKDGFISLGMGLLFLGLCLLGAYFVRMQLNLPEIIQIFLREGLLIIGWVGMWRPVDILLNSWRPVLRKLKVYKRLLKVKFTIV